MAKKNVDLRATQRQNGTTLYVGQSAQGGVACGSEGRRVDLRRVGHERRRCAVSEVCQIWPILKSELPSRVPRMRIDRHNFQWREMYEGPLTGEPATVKDNRLELNACYMLTRNLRVRLALWNTEQLMA